jgi:hypothetical protein
MEDTAPVEAPAAAPETVTETPAAKPDTRESRAQRARDIFKAHTAKVVAAPAPVAEEPKTPVPVNAAVLPEPAKAPEPVVAPVVPDMAAAIAKAMQEAVAADRTRYESEQRAKTLEQELAAEKARIAKVQEDPFRKAILEGRTYEEVTKDLVEGKFTPLTAEQKQFQAFQEELAAARAKSEALEKRWQEEDAQRDLARRMSSAKEKISLSADKYPFVGALDWMHEQAVNLHRAREGEGVDLDTVLGELNAAAQGDLRKVIGSDAALKQLLADDTIKARVLAVLGPASTPQPVQPAEPAVAAPKPRTDVPTAIPARKAGDSGDRVRPPSRSRDERKSAAINAFKRSATRT